MKKNRIYFGLLILALVVTIVWTSAGMLGVNKEEKKYSVSVIVNDSNNMFPPVSLRVKMKKRR